MDIQNNIFGRTELLLGTDTLEAIQQKNVIIFGLGGVGSWCAEALIRTGIQNLTIVDFDNVCPTNVNRQLMATTKSIGKVKVEELKNRLLDINPDAKIIAKKEVYKPENSDLFYLDSYDYIIDAIDSLDSKAHLIYSATKTGATFFSSMGAALKMDPTKVKVTDFWKVQGCPLAAMLRRKIRKGDKLEKKFLAVYSDESLENKQKDITESKAPVEDSPYINKRTNGSLVFVTAAFGLTLASLVIQDIISSKARNI